MEDTKFKPVLKSSAEWLVAVPGVYLFWLISYFILAKFALKELMVLSAESSFSAAVSFSSVFWYLIYLAGLSICLYIVYRLTQYAPQPRIAAVINAVLISASAAVICISLSKTTVTALLLPHVVINLFFLAAGILAFYKYRRPEFSH